MRTAIVGLGRMGMRHVGIIRATALQLVGVCDASRAAFEGARSLGLSESIFFDDAARMLAETRPSLVVVATTAESHASLVQQAAGAGATHILCEKPLATSLAECDEMIAACAAAGAKLAVNHQMRFMEQYTVAKAIAARPEFGGLGSVLVSAGNFGIAMNGTHYFEMFHYMTGEEPARVSAYFSSESVPNPRGAQFIDAAGCVRIESTSGKRFYLDCSADQGHGMLVVYTGRNGRITVDELSGELAHVQREDQYAALPTTRYGMPYVRHSRQIAAADALAPSRAVLDALLSGMNYPNGEDGRRAMAILIAAHVSHDAGGAPVDLRRVELPRDRRLPIA